MPNNQSSHRLTDYIENRLIMACATSFVDDNGYTQYNTTEDGNARCSPSHTFPHIAFETFSNVLLLKSSQPVHTALVAFYANSLISGEPMTANTILCHKNLEVPYPFLKRIEWDHHEWFIFNDRTGLLTDKWWHIFGCFPS